MQITRPPRGEDTTPRVAPDGRSIAFTRCETTNPHAPGCAVWRVAPLGGDERLLVPDCNLGDLHPTAPSLVCMRGGLEGSVAFIDAPLDDSRPPTTLYEWTGPLETLRLSPNGDLAFLSAADPYLLPAATRHPTRLFATPVNVHTLAFSPSGSHLVLDLSRNGRRTLWAAPLYALPVAHEALHPLTLGSGVDLYPDLAADGSLLVYAHETNESVLYVVDPQGKSPRRLDTRTSFLGLALGAVGHLLAVWDADSPSPGDDTAVLELTPLTTPPPPDTSARRLPLTARGLGRGSVPALSPDETHVALVERGALILVDLTTQRRTTLVTSNVREVRPAFSPDGRRLAFAQAGATPGLALQILQDRPEDQPPRLLARGHFSAPVFTPDGSNLVLSGTPFESSASGLYLVDLEPLDSRSDLAAPPPEPRLLSPHRSYEAAPLFLPDQPDLAWVLVDERTTPRLVPVPLGLTLDLPAPITLEVPPDPANWGVFDIAAHPTLGFVYLLKKVHSDIMMVREPPAGTTLPPR